MNELEVIHLQIIPLLFGVGSYADDKGLCLYLSGDGCYTGTHICYMYICYIDKIRNAFN